MLKQRSVQPCMCRTIKINGVVGYMATSLLKIVKLEIEG